MKTYNNFVKEHMTSTGRWGNMGAGILPYCQKTRRFLLSFRSKYVLEPHTWGIWGGKVDEEDMDNIKDAAVRELQEETRYNDEIFLLPSYVYQEKGFTYYNFIGIVREEFEPILDWENENDVIETEDYRWVTIDELLMIKPKHFGLNALIDNNWTQLKKL